MIMTTLIVMMNKNVQTRREASRTPLCADVRAHQEPD
jgi:hypothetical protein